MRPLLWFGCAVRACLPVVPLLSAGASAVHGQVEMIKDISDAPLWCVDDDAPDRPIHLGLGGRILFSGRTPATGRELFVADPTGGVSVVSDAWPGKGGSIPRDGTVMNGVLYYVAQDPTHGREIWRSDGTGAGTRLVRDVRPGPASSLPADLTVFNGRVHFWADDGVHGRELWSTDGTDAGTRMLIDLNPGMGGADAEPRLGSNAQPKMGVSGELLYFAARNGPPWSASSAVLWRTDGTPGGTVALWSQSAPPLEAVGFEPLPAPASPSRMVVLLSVPGGSDARLLVTDGTPSGTRLLHDADPLGAGQIQGLVRLRDAVLFSSKTETGPFELFRTTPGATGVARVLPAGAAPTNPSELFSAGEFVLFRGVGPASVGAELYRTDGTAAGTTLVADLQPAVGPDPSYYGSSPGGFVRFGAETAFEALFRLYRTDGTTAGTRALLPPSLRALSGHFFRTPLPPDGSTIAFWSGRTLYRTDGTDQGSSATPAPPGGSRGTSFRRLFRQGTSTLVLARRWLENWDGLWSTDGREEGTRLVIGFSGDADPSQLVPVGGRHAFVVSESAPDARRRLWVTDGTRDGTLAIDVPPGLSDPQIVASDGARLFFAADDGVHGQELWVTDGTLAGTRLVKDLRPGATGSSLGGGTVLGGRVYFGADDGVSGSQLWASDGSEAGTRRISSLPAGRVEGFHRAIAATSQHVYFVVHTNAQRANLWRTDGSDTRLVAALPALREWNAPAVRRLSATSLGVLVALMDSEWRPHLLRAGPPGEPLVTLYRPAARPEGTAEVDVFFEHEGGVYFQAGAGTLYRTDGTPGGTVLCTSHMNQDAWHPPAAVPGGVCYRGPANAAGRPAVDALWFTDGSEDGARVVARLNENGWDSWLGAGALLRVDDRLYFAADDGIHGTELHAMNLSELRDCNGNRTPDRADLSSGASRDVNRDGRPDECECLADWNADGTPSVIDVFKFLADWFADGADFDGSGATEVEDLFSFLRLWFTGCG